VGWQAVVTTKFEFRRVTPQKKIPIIQSLLGLEGFAEALRGHVTGKEQIREIPKGQRLLGRATLKKLFDKAGKDKAIRDRLISQAVNQHGYSQMEVARHLQLHYSTVSRLIKGVTEQQR
jgi:putative transposase